MRDQGGTNTSRSRPFGVEKPAATGRTEDAEADWAREYGRGLRLLYRADEDLPSEMQALVDKLTRPEDQ